MPLILIYCLLFIVFVIKSCLCCVFSLFKAVLCTYYIWFFTNVWMTFSKSCRSSICNPTMLKAIPRSERIATNQNFEAFYKIFHYKLRKQIFDGWLKNFHTINSKCTSERSSVGFEILENGRWSIISWIFTINELFRWLEFFIGKGRFKKK